MTPSQTLRTWIIIPARLASTRLPNKLLLNQTGHPLIQHTYEAAKKSRLATDVLVACDSSQIFDAVEGFGGKAVMTDIHAKCGTDRVAEVAAQLPNADLIVNVQGDEPDLKSESIDFLIELLSNASSADMATLATPIHRTESLLDPACVKVVFDKKGRALYFSRSLIPYPRNGIDEALKQNGTQFYQHLGIYAYRRDFLLQFTKLPQSPLETTESLEQLRVLDEGYSIQVGVVNEASIGIDTPDDYRRFVERHNGSSPAYFV